MAHPDDLVARLVVEEATGLVRHLELCAAVLGYVRVVDAPAELLRHQLHAVADAEHRHACVEQACVDRGGARRVDGGGASGEDHCASPAAGNLRGRDRCRHELRVHAAVAHAPGDELRILAPEVDHEHGPLLGRRLGERQR